MEDTFKVLKFILIFFKLKRGEEFQHSTRFNTKDGHTTILWKPSLLSKKLVLLYLKSNHHILTKLQLLHYSQSVHTSHHL